MKKKMLWLLLVVPAILIAASSTQIIANMDWQTTACSTSGDRDAQYNGDLGCPYSYDFSSLINCTLDSLDLDKSTPEIEHYLDKGSAEVWYTNSGEIEMVPKEGYGGAGFLVTLNIRAYFSGSYEDEWWNCNVTAGSPPYSPACY